MFCFTLSFLLLFSQKLINNFDYLIFSIKYGINLILGFEVIILKAVIENSQFLNTFALTLSNLDLRVIQKHLEAHITNNSSKWKRLRQQRNGDKVIFYLVFLLDEK